MTDTSSTRLTGRRAAVFGVGVVALEFAAAVATLVVTTLLPVVTRDLDAGDQLAVLLSGSTVGLFTAMAAAPLLLDHVGSRPFLTVGLVLTLTGATWTATAGDAWSFAGGRFVTGFAAGLLAVFGVSAAIQHLDERIRLRVIAASTAMWIVPGLVGPTAAAALEHLAGWRWTILLPIPLVLFGRLLVIRAAPESSETLTQPHRPMRRTLLIPVGIAGFVALTESQLWLLALLPLTLAGVGFAALMPAGTLRLRPGAPAAMASLTLFGVGYFGATSLLTLALTDVLGASLAQAGWALGAGPVAWALTTLTIPRLRERGIAPSPAAGLTVTTIGVVLTGTLLITSATYTLALLTWAAVGAGVGAAYPTLYLRATTPDAATDAHALASAVITTETFGGLVGSTAGGAVISASLSSGFAGPTTFGLAYFAFAAALGVAVLAAVRSNASHMSHPPYTARHSGERA